LYAGLALNYDKTFKKRIRESKAQTFARFPYLKLASIFGIFYAYTDFEVTFLVTVAFLLNCKPNAHETAQKRGTIDKQVTEYNLAHLDYQLFETVVP
jgi:hypothetical protein